MNRFEAFRDMEDRWRWRLLGGNGRALASSNEAFGSQVDALRAAEVVKGVAADAPISDGAGVGPKEVIAGLIRREEARRLKVAAEEDGRPARRRSAGVRRAGIGGSPSRLRAVGARRPA